MYKAKTVLTVHEILTQLNLSQAELCRIIEVAPATINRWGRPNQKSMPKGLDESKIKALMTLAKSKLNKKRIKDMLLNPISSFPKQMIADAVMMNDEEIAVAQMMALLCGDVGRRIAGATPVADILNVLRDKEVT